MKFLIADIKVIADNISERMTQISQGKKDVFFSDSSTNIEFSAFNYVSNENSFYRDLIVQYNLSNEERLILIVAIMPYLIPAYLRQIANAYVLSSENIYDTNVKQLLLVKQYPSVELILFLLANFDLEQRAKSLQLFQFNGKLFTSNILSIINLEGSTLVENQGVQLDKEIAQKILGLSVPPPEFSSDFPASKLTTKFSWTDLILEEGIIEQLNHLISWQAYKQMILGDWELQKVIKPGYRALFYGPPGTGKTLSACLIGKELGMDVYRIDLSMIASKYIGETEKNLSKLFDKAEDRNWILFFDEADALFGTRTNVKDAHDRYANQETSYLLQRIEDFDGLVILASNFKKNIDFAFTRRFQSIVEFKMPNAAQRLTLWKNTISSKMVVEDYAKLEKISNQYDMSGGSILNVVQFCSLKTAQRGNNILLTDDLKEGIRREYSKEGKTI